MYAQTTYLRPVLEAMCVTGQGLAEEEIEASVAWRAGRLVVDTGIHALGWSRQEAVDYLVQNSPLALNNIESEVERYIGMPGQALAYKMGQREILRLRDDARASMGDRFEIKGFHDAVLTAGPVPLEVLGAIVEQWSRQPSG